MRRWNIPDKKRHTKTDRLKCRNANEFGQAWEVTFLPTCQRGIVIYSDSEFVYVKFVGNKSKIYSACNPKQLILSS